jgi:hypothetical protein
MEYDRAVKILETYRESNQKRALSMQRVNNLIDEKFPEITDDDTKYVRAALVEERQELSKILALLRNAHFDNPSFLELIRILEADSVYSDTLISKRIDFLDLIKADLDKAKEMRPSLELGLDEERKFYEISAREPFIEYTLERARQEFNAKLRTAQRKESLYKVQSKVAVAAWSYIGAFVGGWIMYLYGTWRGRKKSSSFEHLE